jgi:GxxExxY protein
MNIVNKIKNIMADFKFADITEKIIDAAMRVHNTLGCGFHEVIYQRAQELEYCMLSLNHIGEFEMPTFYLVQQISTRRVDFFVENKISVELKALTKLEDVHLTQAINYLEAYNLEIGLPSTSEVHDWNFIASPTRNLNLN